MSPELFLARKYSLLLVLICRPLGVHKELFHAVTAWFSVLVYVVINCFVCFVETNAGLDSP